MTTYGQALGDLFARSARGVKLGLEATEELLAALDHPEKRLGHVVLVAGTNGKGSTAALTAAMLESAGHRVGFFSSPHLLQFVERIRVGRERIRGKRVVELYERIREVESACSRKPTFFEATVAMAVMQFADAEVDATVLEVGLGGRLDATNAVPHELAVITPIDLDHTRILGEDVGTIAAEKAAIIPQGGTVVVAPQAEAAEQTLRRFAAERNAAWVDAPSATKCATGLRLEGGPLSEPVELPRYPRAPYMLPNIAAAAAAAATLGGEELACGAEAIRKGAAMTRWPGRFEWLTVPPRDERPSVEMLVDGAHNPAAVAALQQALAADARSAGRPTHLVFSAFRDKSVQPMLERLAKRCRSLHLSPLPSHRSLDRDGLRSLSNSARLYPTPTAALEGAVDQAAELGGYVLVTGSLMLAAEALAFATGAPRDPPVDF